MRVHGATLTLTLSLSEGEGVAIPSPPEGERGGVRGSEVLP